MSIFGRYWTVTTFGESHAPAVGCVVTGVPPRMPLTVSDIQTQLDRRRPGQSDITTPRSEHDRVTILSGIEHGYTLGTPIAMMVSNHDARPSDYKDMSPVPRPSHADYSYQLKYGIRAASGGGRSSARETIGRVAAGAIADKWLHDKFGTRIVAWVSAIGTIAMPSTIPMQTFTRSQIDASAVRCPDATTASAMLKLVRDTRDANDSIGGVITCMIHNVPAGIGEPVFDKLPAVLAAAMMSIPAVRAFEMGSGTSAASMHGSTHNDAFTRDLAAPSSSSSSSSSNSIASLRTTTNNSGGAQGGISIGGSTPLIMRITFKPPATIGLPQPTVTYNGDATILTASGRHDPCVVPRAVPIVEAMAALVCADLAMAQLARTVAASPYPVHYHPGNLAANSDTIAAAVIPSRL